MDILVVDTVIMVVRISVSSKGSLVRAIVADTTTGERLPQVVLSAILACRAMSARRDLVPRADVNEGE